MEKTPLVLSIDFGTQSVRTSLIDKKGNIVAIIKKPYSPLYYSDVKGYAEQDADFYWDYCTESLTELCKDNKDKLNDIVGATLTTFRDSAVLLDKNNKPVRRVILWLDQRTAKAKEKIPTLHRAIFKLIGMNDTIELNRKRTMAHWIKENEPENWSKTKKYVNISTYLIYRMTGNLCDSLSGMTGHYPIDFKNKRWHAPGALKGGIFGIPNRMLCELKNPGELLGVISDEVSDKVGLPRGIKMFATGSDKACETVGLGALSPDVAAISYGTASTIEVSNVKYHEPEAFLPAYAAAIPGWYNMEVQIYRGYWMLTWFSKQFADKEVNEARIQDMAVEEILNAKLSRVPPGSDGLVLQPYWGPGLKRPLAKGAIVGFSDVHTKLHMYRAIIEGIAYALKEGLESIEKSQKHKISKIMISGGGSQSDAICQITADIFGLPVYRVQTFETTSLGAALATFVACGEYSSYEEAKEQMVRETTSFEPNKVAQQQYKYLYNKVYLKMYPQMSDIYKSITKYNKKY